jgi:DNA repair protein RecO (recombination protein O)
MFEKEQQAFVLHSRPLNENKQIFDLFTEQEGKVSAAAYISTSKKSDKKGLLQPFLPLKVVLKGKGTLKSLSRVEADGTSFSLGQKALFSGFYLNELLVKLFPEHIYCATLYSCYRDSLQQLSDGLAIEQVLRAFELSLLDELGIAVDFSPVFEIECSSFYYIPEKGFEAALYSANLPCYSRTHLQNIANQQLDSIETLRTYKLLMRQLITPLLGGKPLNSRKLFIR